MAESFKVQRPGRMVLFCGIPVASQRAQSATAPRSAGVAATASVDAGAAHHAGGSPPVPSRWSWSESKSCGAWRLPQSFPGKAWEAGRPEALCCKVGVSGRQCPVKTPEAEALEV